jgi:hypothetical protein
MAPGSRQASTEYGYDGQHDTTYDSPESSFSEMIEAIAVNPSAYSFSDPEDNY